MTHQEELVEYITRVFGITEDCNTFLWLRFTHKQAYRSRLKLGGGNLLMAAGLFSSIEYLAKIHAFINNKPNPENATEAFANLILDSPYKLSLDNLDTEELQKTWNRWRNKLIHVLVPSRGTVLAFEPDQSHPLTFEQTRDQLEKTPGNIFIKRENNWELSYVDQLTAGVNKLAQWVISECQKPCKNIESALNWIKQNAE